MADNKRFDHVDKQSGFTSSYEIIVDRETGVNYLVVKSGYGTGVTPLLGRDGKPVISPISGTR